MTYLDHLGAYRVDHPLLPEACGRLLMVGEDNPQSADPKHALFPMPSGVAGHRLQEKILKVFTRTHLSTWRTNLCNPRWSQRAARDRARALLDPSAPWRTIVLLGRKVAGAFGLDADFFTTHRSGPHALVLLPHPGGRCRAWNVRGATARARELITRVEPDFPCGELP